MEIKSLFKKILGLKSGSKPEKTALEDLNLECRILRGKEGEKWKIVGLALVADLNSEGHYFIADFNNANNDGKAKISIQGDRIYFRILGKGEKRVSFIKDPGVLEKLRVILKDKGLKKDLKFKPVIFDERSGDFQCGFQVLCKPEPEFEAAPI